MLSPAVLFNYIRNPLCYTYTLLTTIVMLKKFKRNFNSISLSVLIALLLINTVLIFYNRAVMVENNQLQAQTEQVKELWISIFDSNLRRMDLGLRGFALTRNAQLLDPYRSGMRDLPICIKNIDSLLVVQSQDSLATHFAAFKLKLDEYVAFSERMRLTAEEGNTEEFVKMLNEDKGYDLWQAFAPMFNYTLSHQDKLMAEARAKYQTALDRNVIFQIILIALAIPALISVMYRIKRDVKARKNLLLEFEDNNRKYMFNPGTPLPDDNPQIIIQNSIENLKKTSSFIKSIAGGNYGVTWEGLTPENEVLNKENLTGDLIKMRDQMKIVKETDERRIWSTEGLAKFSEVARSNQHDIEKLSNEVIRFLTKHMRSQQGSLFLLQDDENQEPFLSLAACYAFDKRKFLEKRIEIGSGLIGQAYLEGSTMVLKQIPNGYIKITSGMGDATPTCLVIVPMKYNDRVEAVLELASFEEFQPHEIEFLEKAGEVIASSVYSTKTNERTTKLLTATQQQTEMLKAQEEELRQNMEEMQATQENMRRLEKESV
jgi:CHASE3 domain sensor protein